MGKDMAQALAGYHVFSGCDSVSAFVRKGKKRGFQILKTSETFQQAFKELGVNFDLEKSVFQKLESFVCALYGHSGDNIDDVRYTIFCTTGVDQQKLPPCKDALFLHIMRVNYQCAFYTNALDRYIDAPSANDHGWVINDNKINIRWITREEAPPSLLKFDHCKCKSGCETQRCSCNKVSVHCTDLCGCVNCRNILETQQESEQLDDDICSSDDDNDDDLMI
jgi:hypothetical protein